jgi:hypothetical protein
VVDRRRALWLARSLARRTGVAKQAAPAAAPPAPPPAPPAWGSDGPGAAHGVGLAGPHDAGAADAVERPGGTRERRGASLVVARLGAGDPPTAGAGQVVGGPPPDVSSPLTPFSLQSSTASRASGIHGAPLAGPASLCTS